MTVAYAEVQLGAYARKCVDVISGFVPGREHEVEPAIRVLAAVYAAEDAATVEDRFKEDYRLYKAAADTVDATNKAGFALQSIKEGN